MPYNKFPPGCLVVIDGGEHRFTGYAGGRMQLHHVTTGLLFVATGDDGVTGPLTDELFSKLLREHRISLTMPRSTPRARLLGGVPQWAMDQAVEQDPASAKRAAQCQALDAVGAMNGTKAIEVALKKHWTAELIAKFGPHDPARSIRRWRAERGSVGHRHPGDMVSHRGLETPNSRSIDVPREVEWKHALAHQQDRAKQRDTYAAYYAEMILINSGGHPNYAKPDTPYRIVSKETMRRRCNALESKDTALSKLGEEAVEQDWAGGGKPLTADFAMQRVIIDHTKLDVFAVDDEFEMVLGRAWLTLAVDVKTRAVVAHLISFIDPSNWTVGEILRRMALPKRIPVEFDARYPILRDLRGKPTEIIVDNAVEFRSHMMEAAARGWGFSVRFCPIRRPRYRAIGERTIGTVVRMICEMLPGRTLSLAEARRLGHDAEDEACVIMIELEAVAVHAICEFNTSPNDGIGGRQPALMFERDANRYGIANFVDLSAFRIDTMDIMTGAQLSPSGIRAFGGLRYHDVRAVPELLSDLRPLEARRQRRDDATATVDFRYDPMDIGCIHVWNRKTRRYVKLVCSDERYGAGMPLWFHEQIRAAAAAEGAAFNTAEERAAARARRVAAIKAINPEDGVRARKTVAELYEIPRLRQIVGNIVHLDVVQPEAVALRDFIPHDRAAETALDLEILAPRPAPAPDRKKGRNRRDRRDAGLAQAAPSSPKLSADPVHNLAAPRRRTAMKGSYE